MERYEKVYVAMILRVNADGNLKPVAVEWEDGTLYEIDRVIDERNAPPELTGGVLTRKYTVLIGGKEKKLYAEKRTGKWFLERAVRS